jgi:hypothetical protein
MCDLIPNHRTIKRLNLAIQHKQQSIIDGGSHVNHMWTIIRMFPDVNYNKLLIALNKHTTVELIHLYGGSNINTLLNLYCQNNKHINWQTIISNPSLPWDFELLSSNTNISIYNIIEHKHLPWDWSLVSIRSDITMELANQDLPWHIGCLYANSYLNWQQLKYEPEWFYISKRSDLKLEWIISNINQEWCWSLISANSNITWDMVIANPGLPWCYKRLSMNTNITWPIVINNPNKPWCIHGLLANPSVIIPEHSISISNKTINVSGLIFLVDHPLTKIPWKHIEANLDLEWDWHEISTHKDININIIRQYIHKPWSWRNLSINSIFTLANIRSNLDLPWSWVIITLRRTISFTDIKNNLDLPWTYHVAYRADMNYAKLLELNMEQYWYYLSKPNWVDMRNKLGAH